MPATTSTPARATRIAAALLAALAWTALALQLYLAVNVGALAGTPPSTVLVNFFSFFTILSNLQVALATTAIALSSSSNTVPPTNPLLSPAFQTATAVSIVTVGLGYSLLLRHIWDPQGLQKLVDILLHDVVPVLYPIFWFFTCAHHQPLSPRIALRFTLWPIAYTAYSLVRGAATHYYPYPFLNAQTLGYPKVIAITAVLFATYLALSLLATTITRHRTA
jgi:hypothetical protein